MRQPRTPRTPIGEAVCWDGEDMTVVGYVYYGEAGWYYILLDEYMEEHDVYVGDVDD